jgi:hypothetical protein
MKRKPIDQALKAEALELADRVGAAEAARQTGVSAGTIRAWRSREGRVEPPPGVDLEDWAATKRDGAAETWRAARRALESVNTLLEDGDERKAKDAALTMAILIDKSGALSEAAERADQRQTTITERQAWQLAESVRLALGDLDLDLSAIRYVFAARVDGDVDLEAAERAKLQIRQQFAPEPEPLALLPPPPPEPESAERRTSRSPRPR